MQKIIGRKNIRIEWVGVAYLLILLLLLSFCLRYAFGNLTKIEAQIELQNSNVAMAMRLGSEANKREVHLEHYHSELHGLVKGLTRYISSPDQNQQAHQRMLSYFDSRIADIVGEIETDETINLALRQQLSDQLKVVAAELSDVSLQDQLRQKNGKLELVLPRIDATLQASSSDIRGKILQYEQSIDSNVSHWQSIRKKFIETVSVVAPLLITLPIILFGGFYLVLYRRLRSLALYAENIRNQNYQGPPFFSNDMTGRLAASMEMIGVTTQELLYTTQVQARRAEVAHARESVFANQDSLTELANRRRFKTMLDDILKVDADRNNYFLLFLDLDDFKLVNDMKGHEAGDEMLKHIGQRLNATMRPDDLVARLGGDEFAVLVRCNPNDIEAVVERVEDAVTRPIKTKYGELKSGVSIGVTTLSQSDVSADDLLRQADIAMYQSKQLGKHIDGRRYTFFNSDMEREIARRQSILSEMKLAIANEQFELYYQPKINLFDQNCVGYEALIRWNHPVQGMVPPDEFIPYAEDSGLITEIGEWVMDKACFQVSQLYKRGFQMPVAINVSTNTFYEKNFVNSVKCALERHSLPGSMLEIEITESLLMKELETGKKIIQELHDMDLRVALDDFGTGYSSISYLKELMVDTLKIDKSFIQIEHPTKRETAILSSIIAMGKNINVEIVAEGLETMEQYRLLLGHGCEVGQGYLFARPMSFENLLLFIHRGGRTSGLHLVVSN